MRSFQSYVNKLKKNPGKKVEARSFILTRHFPPYEVLQNVGTTTAEPSTKCSMMNGGGKPTGQPAIGLHQSSVYHGTFPNQRAHPQISHIHPSTVLLPKKVKVTKDTRFTQHCIAAASQLLTPQQTSALKDAGM